MVTATQIAHWAKTMPAQAELPRLIRRLIHGVAQTSAITMPAGDSVTLPGFDGDLHSEHGNAWVPAGYSCWELSCRADVTKKANEDYKKRKGFPSEYHETRTYVALTARRWPSKARWREEKIADGVWKDVRAYDADDIEQWLEQVPAVRLFFGEKLGLSGAGVESLANYLQKWSAQCIPPITPDALLTGRAEQARKLIKCVRNIRDGVANGPLAIKTDSVEEATAFTAATLLEQPDLETISVVVTSVEGWRFVETNEAIQVAVAVTPLIAELPPVRDRLAVVISYASGDMASQFKGVAGKLNDAELLLDRALPSEFKQALQRLGLDQNDTRRWSKSCGRSWSVFRRQHSANPLIRQPAWVDHPASGALATVCLVGNWSTGTDADTDIIARISGRAYAELEADLLALERLDDSPLLHIGEVWKAKSALELLAVFGHRITPAQLERYFDEVEAVLVAPDPQLELADDQRYAAEIYGKVRPISGQLLSSLCDTLIKLAVRGIEIPMLAAMDIQGRVDSLVRKLLRGSDRVRWLSLANQLPALAEASPHEFLTAVERGIIQGDNGVLAVFLETSGATLGSQCWHSGMLWALETLAWAPNRLRRVSLILAQLCSVEIKGNWGNNPKNSLLSLYRSWFPQTAATVEQRISVIDDLIEKIPDTAFELLNSITSALLNKDFATHTARPKWRDDDAGVGYGATKIECHTMEVAAIDRQILMSCGNAERIAQLVLKYAMLDNSRQQRVTKLLTDCVKLADTDKEILRAALRQKLHWHRNYDKREDIELSTLLDPLEAAYAALEPNDCIIRNAWLFKSQWVVDLPIRTRGEALDADERQGKAAARAALKDIFESGGWPSILKLAEKYGDPWTIGYHLPHVGLSSDVLCRWIVDEEGDLYHNEAKTVLTAAILCCTLPRQREDILNTIFTTAPANGRSADWLARLLILCPHDPTIWQRAEEIKQSQYYWSNCSNNLRLDEPTDITYALGKLIEHSRPVSALNACCSSFSICDPKLVIDMLEGILKGQELTQCQMLNNYVFQKAFDFIEDAGTIDEMRLAQIEFGLIQMLGFQGEHHAKTLYRVLMSRPEIFLELLCLLYPPHGGSPRELDETQRWGAQNAWHILHACRQQPGTSEDGIINANRAAIFVKEVRRLAAEQDRLGACDSILGEILASAPVGADGIWPEGSAQLLLEDTGSEEMLDGFYIGACNRHSFSMRNLYEGGDQERELATYFRKYALKLEPTHPQLAATLFALAKLYDRHGLLADFDGRLRIEEG
ncbi:MAG: hypothetical protein ABF697_09165 [Zymomonas mobilis]|uniref:hypothetical protein n=1 Tax=Zymomonas mobilis TaxID=542 RepID=UPI0039EC3378